MENRGRKTMKQEGVSIVISFTAPDKIQEKLEKIALSEYRSITQQATLFLIQCIKNYQINGD